MRTLSAPFSRPRGLIFGLRRKSNRELEQFSVDETADRAESLTENLNSFRLTNFANFVLICCAFFGALRCAEIVSRTKLCFGSRNYSVLFFQNFSVADLRRTRKKAHSAYSLKSRKSLTENLNSFRLTKTADFVIYFFGQVCSPQR